MPRQPVLPKGENGRPPGRSPDRTLTAEDSDTAADTSRIRKREILRDYGNLDTGIEDDPDQNDWDSPPMNEG